MMTQGRDRNDNGERGDAPPPSGLSGFYRLDLAGRRALCARLTGVSEGELRALSAEAGLSDEQAERMAENVLGVMSLPLGVCLNLRVDGRDCVVPMATEEPSVVAAASHAAKLLRAGGGIGTTVTPPHMIGQVQILEVPDPTKAEEAVRDARAELLAHANRGHASLVAAGGGAIDLEVHHLAPLGPSDPVGPMMVVHFIVDVRDAMGANAINSMCEAVAPLLADLTGGRIGLRILSNLADRRTVTARGQVPFAALRGRGKEGLEAAASAAELARGIVEASVFAERDPYRAATHNKGIMNGVDSVLLAFGQDWRAVEAGAHAFAARGGRYTALARWRIEGDALVGELTLPMAVGTVGGVAGVHPTVRVTRRLAGVGAAAELASVAASVGLAQNLGALRALAAEGIQRGHMRLHARNVAVEAGAVGEEIDEVARLLSERGTVNLAAAQEVLREREAHRRSASRIPSIYAQAAAAGAGTALLERFEALREQHWPRIEALVEETTGESTPAESSLLAMCRYHMETGGKRLRALLPLLTAEALGADPGKLVPLGAACEMLHNATLVHDDLQDGDVVRRGMLTVWNRFGVPQAINLGDAMFYYTLLLVQRLELPAPRREAVAHRVLRETLRVIDGQEREFALRGRARPTPEDYFAMVEGKTSGLFALPMAAAAELCDAPADVVAGLEEAARHMGVLFQIQDDALDLFGEKGRATRGSDVAEGKRSLLVVHALAEAPAAEARWLLEVLDKSRATTTTEEVAGVLALLERTGSLAFALDEILRRKACALAVPSLAAERELLALVEGMSELFLKPIEPLVARRRQEVKR
jgi:hydroxymethylglutaryl-CoA reductase